MTPDIPLEPTKATESPPDNCFANSTRALIAAALYSFAAALTTRKVPITLGGNHSAVPAATAVDEFLKDRNIALSAYSDPPIKDWRDRLGNREMHEQHIPDIEGIPDFKRELAGVLNKFSMDNYAGMPDFVLAQAIATILDGLNVARTLQLGTLPGADGDKSDNTGDAKSAWAQDRAACGRAAPVVIVKSDETLVAATARAKEAKDFVDTVKKDPALGPR